MDAPKPRRWFRFSLRTLFVLVTIFGIGGPFLAQQAALWRARHTFDKSTAAWEAGAIPTNEFFSAAKQLFDKESSAPFADRGKAAIAYLDRMREIKIRFYKKNDRLMDVNPAKAIRDTKEFADYYWDVEQIANQYQ